MCVSVPLCVCVCACMPARAESRGPAAVRGWEQQALMKQMNSAKTPKYKQDS